MMATAHAQALSTRHANLDAMIAAEAQRPNPDGLAIKRMKAEKLRLKDAIARDH